MNSIHIILERFKKDHLSEEEAISLIEDLYSNKSNIPTFPQCPQPIFPQWPQITYTEPKYQKWEVTCVDK